jgi:hypothetical protein
LVAGRNRVPNPATGKTALRTGLCISSSIGCPREIRAIHVPRDLTYRQAEQSV